MVAAVAARRLHVGPHVVGVHQHLERLERKPFARQQLQQRRHPLLGAARRPEQRHARRREAAAPGLGRPRLVPVVGREREPRGGGGGARLGLRRQSRVVLLRDRVEGALRLHRFHERLLHPRSHLLRLLRRRDAARERRAADAAPLVEVARRLERVGLAAKLRRRLGLVEIEQLLLRRRQLRRALGRRRRVARRLLRRHRRRRPRLPRVDRLERELRPRLPPLLRPV